MIFFPLLGVTSRNTHCPHYRNVNTEQKKKGWKEKRHRLHVGGRDRCQVRARVHPLAPAVCWVFEQTFLQSRKRGGNGMKPRGERRRSGTRPTCDRRLRLRRSLPPLHQRVTESAAWIGPRTPAGSDARQPALTERVRERSHIPAHGERERERGAEAGRGRGRGGVGGGETESGARSTPRR